MPHSSKARVRTDHVKLRVQEMPGVGLAERIRAAFEPIGVVLSTQIVVPKVLRSILPQVANMSMRTVL